MKRPPEMSRVAFQAALKRRGFKQVLLWIEDTTGQVPGTSWGILLHAAGPNKGKIMRRATLAHVIRERDAQVKRNEDSIKSRGFTNPDAKTIVTGEVQ